MALTQSGRVVARYSVDIVVRLRGVLWPERTEFRAKDVSRGGLFICTNAEPKLHSDVEVGLDLPWGDNLVLEARIVHVMAAQKAKQLGVEGGFGLEFVSLSTETKLQIERLVLWAHDFQRLDTAYASLHKPASPAQYDEFLKTSSAGTLGDLPPLRTPSNLDGQKTSGVAGATREQPDALPPSVRRPLLPGRDEPVPHSERGRAPAAPASPAAVRAPDSARDRARVRQPEAAPASVRGAPRQADPAPVSVRGVARSVGAAPASVRGASRAEEAVPASVRGVARSGEAAPASVRGAAPASVRGTAPASVRGASRAEDAGPVSVRGVARKDGVPAEGQPTDLVRSYLSRAIMAHQRRDYIGADQALNLLHALDWDQPELRPLYEDLDRRVAVALADSYEKQARTEQKHERWMNAARSWLRVCRGRPGDANCHASAAIAVMEAGGNLRQARDLAERAVQLAPQDGSAHEALGRVYERAGQPLNATRELELAAKLGGRHDPNDVGAERRTR